MELTAHWWCGVRYKPALRVPETPDGFGFGDSRIGSQSSIFYRPAFVFINVWLLLSGKIGFVRREKKGVLPLHECTKSGNRVGDFDLKVTKEVAKVAEGSRTRRTLARKTASTP